MNDERQQAAKEMAGDTGMTESQPIDDKLHPRFMAGYDAGLKDGRFINERDPMDWPLPCDVTVGHGTMRKGVKLSTLVLRMKALYKMATGEVADEVAARTTAERQALFEKLDPLATAPAKEPPRRIQLALEALDKAIADGSNIDIDLHLIDARRHLSAHLALPAAPNAQPYLYQIQLRHKTAGLGRTEYAYSDANAQILAGSMRTLYTNYGDDHEVVVTPLFAAPAA